MMVVSCRTGRGTLWVRLSSRVCVDRPRGLSYLAVERPTGAVSAFEIVVGLRGIGDTPGGRVVGDLLADPVRHQAEQHLLHHGPGVIEIAVGLAAGAVGDVVALAFAGVERSEEHTSELQSLR